MSEIPCTWCRPYACMGFPLITSSSFSGAEWFWLNRVTKPSTKLKTIGMIRKLIYCAPIKFISGHLLSLINCNITYIFYISIDHLFIGSVYGVEVHRSVKYCQRIFVHRSFNLCTLRSGRTIVVLSVCPSNFQWTSKMLRFWIPRYIAQIKEHPHRQSCSYNNEFRFQFKTPTPKLIGH